MAQRTRYLAWTLQILLALFFLLQGLGKLGSHPEVLEKFRGWGLPEGSHFVFAGIEILGGIGLLIPRLVIPVAWGLIAFLLAAVVNFLWHGEVPGLVASLVCMALLGLLLYLRRPARAPLRAAS